MSKAAEWTWKEKDILAREFPKRTNAEMTKLLKRSQSSIANMANQMGLKKEHYGIVWTPQMEKILRDFFPIMFNKPLAKWLQVSQRTMLRKARELGLEKQDGFLETRRVDIKRLASEAIKNSPDPKGTRFKKGEHRSPGTEFKKGHQMSEEAKAKQSASLKESWKRRKKERVKLY